MRNSTSRAGESRYGLHVAKLVVSAALLTAVAGAQSAADWTITTIAGTGTQGFSGDGGPATAAQLSRPTAVVTDGAGNLYLADNANHRVRKVDPLGIITTIAGTGASGFSGDGGPATAAQLRSPWGLALDGAGNLFIADQGNHRIRKVDPSGVITTVAGTGTRGFSGDGGPASAAQLAAPRDGVVVDRAGNLYIADRNNNRIRKVDPLGIITTIAGTGTRGFGGDGGPATQAWLNYPADMVLDGAGNLYIADNDNHRIRMVNPLGVITTVAGTGANGFGGDSGPATQARLFHPNGLALDGAGNLYITDYWNDRIRKVNPSGIITTIAGTGERGFGGDAGPAPQGRLYNPRDVALDAAGNLYIADEYNHRVRILTPPATGPAITAILNAASFTPGAAPDSIASLFGERLAPATAASSALPLLSALAGVRIEIIDATQAAHAARLLYASPWQINFLLPGEAAQGEALLRLTREGENPVELPFMVNAVAPGLFSANGTGEGIGAITAFRIAVDGTLSHPAVFRPGASTWLMVGVPLDLGGEGDRVFLTLLGTGIRGAREAFEAVQVTIGGHEIPVLFAGAQGDFPGLDQVDVGPLPRSLTGMDEVDVAVTVAGITSNTVTIVME